MIWPCLKYRWHDAADDLPVSAYLIIRYVRDKPQMGVLEQASAAIVRPVDKYCWLINFHPPQYQTDLHQRPFSKNPRDFLLFEALTFSRVVGLGGSVTSAS